MAYCSKADIINSMPDNDLIELTDDAGAGTADDAVIDRAIEDADSAIDLACRARYTVPFTTVDNVIRKISVDIAIWNIYSRRDKPSPNRLVRYTEANIKLKAIQLGDFNLDFAETGPDSAAIEVKPEFTKGKVDYDGDLLGDVMGQWDQEGGSLDEW